MTWDWVNLLAESPSVNGGEASSSGSLTSPIIYSLTALFPPFQVSDVFQAYGEPDYIKAGSGYGVHGDFSYNFTMIYIKQGFLFTYYGSNKDTKLKPELFIEDIEFFAPGSNGFKLSNEGSMLEQFKTQEQLVNWEGFKDFNFYCRKATDNNVVPCK